MRIIDWSSDVCSSDRRNRMPSDVTGHLDHFQNGETVPIPQVVACTFPTGGQAPQRQQVCVAKILNVDVVPDATAVRGFVIVPVNRDMRTTSRRDLKNQGDEMGFGFMALAKPGFHVRAGSVEAAQ